MAGVQEFSEKVIDYATRLSDVADAAQGRRADAAHGRRRSGGGLVRWTVLPASGAALLALVKSEFFARQAKEVANEAKSFASELPEDLLAVVRQTGATGGGTNASQTGGSTRSSAKSVAKTRPRKAASKRRASPTRKRSSSAQ